MRELFAKKQSRVAPIKSSAPETCDDVRGPGTTATVSGRFSFLPIYPLMRLKLVKVAVLTSFGELIVANVGDSRAVLCCDSAGQPIALSRYLVLICYLNFFRLRI